MYILSICFSIVVKVLLVSLSLSSSSYGCTFDHPVEKTPYQCGCYSCQYMYVFPLSLFVCSYFNCSMVLSMTVLSHSYRIANKFFKSDRRLLFFFPRAPLIHIEQALEKHQVEKIANSVESLIEIRIDTAFVVDFIPKQLSSCCFFFFLVVWFSHSSILQ